MDRSRIYLAVKTVFNHIKKQKKLLLHLDCRLDNVLSKKRKFFFFEEKSKVNSELLTKIEWLSCRDLRETIESGPLCITDLFQNKPVAYF